MKINVIPYDATPTRLPLFQTLTTVLALDHWNAPGWLWGAMAAVTALIWGGAIYRLWIETAKPLPGYGNPKGEQ